MSPIIFAVMRGLYLHPIVNMLILRTVVYTISEVLLGRICLTIIASLIANHFLFFIDILAKDMFWSYINEMLNVKRKKKTTRQFTWGPEVRNKSSCWLWIARVSVYQSAKLAVVYFILKIKKMNTSIYFLCYLLIFLFCKIIRLAGGKS